MEGERRKRKMEKVEIVEVAEEEEEEEEEKMNKFFALIRSRREVRERLIITTTSAIAGEQIRNQPPRPAATAMVWKPAFLAEDFVDPCHNRAAVADVNRSKIAINLESSEVAPSNGEEEELAKIVEKEEEREEKDNLNEKEGEGLDLNLSL
ncbi:hypothetical protein LguiA_008277 [Lonicera macranthoides]